jgi:hypothetical protein
MLQWHVAETCAVWPTEQGGSPKSDHLAEGWQQVIYRSLILGIILFFSSGVSFLRHSFNGFPLSDCAGIFVFVRTCHI